MSDACSSTSSNQPPSWLPILLAGLGAFFYWLGLPPAKQAWAGFVAAFFFSAAIYAPCQWKRSTYLAVYGIGCLLWLSLLQGIRLAFWPLYGGWFALSLYLAVYLPAYIAIGRSLRTSFHIPFPIACAVAWTGLELIRSYVATGFSACMLAHTQTPWPPLLGVSAHFGMFGVSFFVMLSGATFCFVLAKFLERNCDDRPIPLRGERWGASFSASICIVWLVASLVSYARYDRFLASNEPIKPLGRLLIVQGNMPTMFESDPEGLRVSWSEYARLTRRAFTEGANQPVDAVLWPESTFDDGVPLPGWFDWDQASPFPPEWPNQPAELVDVIERRMKEKWNRLTPNVPFPVSYLVGSGVLKLNENGLARYNAALWIKPPQANDSIPEVDYYSKRHLVMFGEYIPFADWFPGLLASFGLGALDAGDRFVAWTLPSGAVIAPSVCFEDVVPQLVQKQVVELSRQGKTPDVLINVTNDAWFRGSSLLDHHLNNAIGCAVENRRPMLVAANSGISAWIDGSGRVVQSLDRFEEGTILAEPIPDARWGLWQRVGDLPARGLGFVALLPFLRSVFCFFLRRIFKGLRKGTLPT
ncbi:apolipoprotein N-acyltransferase [Pirellulaceae bacterium SH501]